MCSAFKLYECQVKNDIFQLKIFTVLCFIFKMAYFLYLQIEMMTEVFAILVGRNS